MAANGELSGRTIKRYRFEEAIGEGASSEVYRATDLHLRREVAVKAIGPEFLEAPGRTRQILREARIHARLEHVNVVRVYDLLKVEGYLFLVMRLLKGLSLRDILEQRGAPLEPKEVVGYARQFLRGVGFAHSMGIVHLDLKPHNIQITPAGEALIMDFGVARMLEERRRTATGMVAGSPAYMAPEQAQGLYTDARSDIYSIGMTLYELLAGRHPFVQARSVKEVLGWQIERVPPRLSEVARDVPAEVERAVMRALRKEPSKRFRSCREFSRTLRTAWYYQQQARDRGKERLVEEVLSPEPSSHDDAQELAAGETVPVRYEKPSERRWDPRGAVLLFARVIAGGGMAFVNGEVINLSASGLALRMPYRPSRGASVQVEFDPPNAKDAGPIRAVSDVVWVRRTQGGEDYEVGLRFSEITDEDRRRVADLVRDKLVLGDESAGSDENG